MVAGFLYEYILCYMRTSSLRIVVLLERRVILRDTSRIIFSRDGTHIHTEYRTSNTPFWGKFIRFSGIIIVPMV